MRRISLAAALLGAVAAAGCGGAGGVTPASSDGNKGVENASFKLVVRGEGAFLDPATNTTVILPKFGVITSTPAGIINCGVNGAGTLNKVCEATLAYGTAVTLNAVPNTAGWVHGWAGACTGGVDACAVSMIDTKFVAVRFAATTAGIGAHGPYGAPEIHANEYLKFETGTAGAYDCMACHGTAPVAPPPPGSQATFGPPSCASCHAWPLQTAGGKSHFIASLAPWGDHGTGWAAGCVRCHTNEGFRDYVGVDGSADNLAGKFLPTNTAGSTSVACSTANPPTCAAGTIPYGPLKCVTCHNPVTDPLAGSAKITKVYWFEAGSAKTPVEASATFSTVDPSTGTCAQCHQGRESGASINQKIAAKAPANDDATITGSFMNPHYLGAAATLFGSEAGGWVQYPSRVYTGKNQHGGKAGCTFCHNAHTLELPADRDIEAECGACHFNEAGARVKSFLELEESRQFGYEGDIDGDGVQESLKLELDGLAAVVLSAMQKYEDTVVPGATLTYSDNYPYFALSASPAGVWTPRLMRAAVNYKWAKTDFAAWAHNPRYAIEVLYDAVYDLNAGTVAKGGTAVAFTGRRSFNGHFGAAGFAPEPYAQFLYHPAAGSPYGTPGSGFTSASCYQCHGGQGAFEQYLAAAPAAPTAMTKVTGMQCTTCHLPVTGEVVDFTELRTVSALFVPPQKPTTGAGQVSFASADLPPGFALCATCHTGLENMASVDAKIATMADPALFTASFVNGHYFGAAGIILGGDAKVLYQYAGKTYQGKAVNWSTDTNGPHGSPHGARCAGCHDPQFSKHSFEIDTTKTVVNGTFYGQQNTKSCDACHVAPYELAPAKANLQQLGADLLTAIKAYAVANNAGVAVCYAENSYPYFLKDLNGNGVCDAPTETARTNGYTFDAKLLKAAYNYQWFVKDPGAAEHNYIYIGQVLFDSIEDLGGTTAVARP